MIRTTGAVLCWGLFAGAAFGQPFLYLKTRTVDPIQGGTQTAVDATRSATQRLTSTGPIHVIIQFEAPPDEAVRAELERRGAAVLDYIPDNSFLATASEDLNLDGMNVRWSGPMRAEDKISPRIDRQPAIGALLDAGDFVVAFHKDVSIDTARMLIASIGIELRDNPDLAPDHLLVRANAAGIVALSNWDEVAYLFPASGDLSAGRPTRACAGAVTTTGTVGQYTARVGDGWDGPGLGAAQVNYFFSQMTSQIPVDSAKAEIVRALEEWSRIASVTFAPGSSATGSRTISILFASGAHGDGYPFDGPGNVLAHTFYPAPPNPEPLAGDMHLDDSERWRIGSDIDLYSVALHELGHALGLGHSDKPGAVMYPYYSKATSLTAEDIGAILSLYAPASATPAPGPLTMAINPPGAQTTNATVILSGTTGGGSAPVVVNWMTDRGDSGLAVGSASWTATVNLKAGANHITMTASDAQQQSTSATVLVTRSAPTPSPVFVQITGPTTAASFSTATSSVVLSGTASDPSGIAQVTWTSSRGASGTASGTTTWSLTPPALALGTTNFTVRATAGSGASSERTLAVTYQPTVAPPDVTPPSITIRSPASTYFYTSSTTLTFVGTASDNVGVSAVSWSTNTGKSGVASGTTSWTAAIAIVSGANYVKIQAADAAGNTSWRTVVVVRN